MKKKKIAIVVTSVLMVKFFLEPHIRALSEHYDLTLILKKDRADVLEKLDVEVRIIEIPIERKINLFKDLCALWRLFIIFRYEHFDLIHTITPKAGLLGTLAAWLAFCPRRLHTFQGEVWANRKGGMRVLLKSLDCLVARLTTNLTVVSRGEEAFLIGQGVIPRGKSTVLGAGSISGVDLTRFSYNEKIRNKIRSNLSISHDKFVFIYVGRFNEEKGLPELLEAFSSLVKVVDRAHLLLVGVDENAYLYNLLKGYLSLESSVTVVDYTENPEGYFMAADAHVLPSHREGFGVVIIEAAAVGIPSIGSNIYGIGDAIKDGETGILFELKNKSALLEAMLFLIKNPSSRLVMGNNARKWVEQYFNQNIVVGEMLDYYHSLFVNHMH